MPKIKTNRMAYKKFRTNAKGKAKKAKAFTSHNTGKRLAKRNRQLKGRNMIDKTNEVAVSKLLPYAGKGH